MSNIQERLDSLQPHIIGIRYVQGVQVVDAAFKSGWTIPDSDIIKKDLIEKDNNYYVFYTEKEGVTFDDLLDYIEGIISINIEREKKHELFKAKVKELQEIFKTNNLSKLKLLNFKFDEPVLSFDSSSEINIDITPNEVVEEKQELDESNVPEEREDDTNSEVVNETTETSVEENTDTSVTRKVKNQEIELPPKREKIELQEFKKPEIICNCSNGEICIECAE
tara:strand:- start:124 stop:792 length:669 start_codon:yes stop_codon:yes gene_type:complete